MEADIVERQDTPPGRIYIETTLALIKPDAVDKADEIQDIILRSGFTILQVMSTTPGHHRASCHGDEITSPCDANVSVCHIYKRRTTHDGVLRTRICVKV